MEGGKEGCGERVGYKAFLNTKDKKKHDRKNDIN